MHRSSETDDHSSVFSRDVSNIGGIYLCIERVFDLKLRVGYTLLETNISPEKSNLKMIDFPFPQVRISYFSRGCMTIL